MSKISKAFYSQIDNQFEVICPFCHDITILGDSEVKELNLKNEIHFNCPLCLKSFYVINNLNKDE